MFTTVKIMAVIMTRPARSASIDTPSIIFVVLVSSFGLFGVGFQSFCLAADNADFAAVVFFINNLRFSSDFA